MPSLIYRNPNLNLLAGTRIQPDPDQINENFEDIARLCNGNLGTENLQDGSISTASLACPRSLHSLMFGVDTTLSWPTNGVLFEPSSDVRVVAIGVGSASTSPEFAADLKVDGTVVYGIVSPTDPHQVSYLLNDIDVDVTAGQTVSLDVSKGSAKVITIYLTAGHSA